MIQPKENILNEELFEAFCDNCSDFFEDKEGHGIFGDRLSLKDKLMEADWLFQPMYQKHICPKCYYIDLNSEVQIVHSRRILNG